MLRAAAVSPIDDAQAAQDGAAWLQIEDSLAEVERLARWTSEAAPRWTPGDLLAHLEDVCATETLGVASDDCGAVRVLTAESARGLQAPYVFLCGLSEKAFPPPNRDDCLYTDADARRWGASGLPLPSNTDRARFEMLLFYEIATRATRHLVLSYPALDSQAQTLVPSPYLREVEQIFGSGQIARNESPHLDCVPPTDNVVSPREFRLRAVSEALAGREKLFELFCAHPATRGVAGSIVAGLAMTESREEQLFGPYEGMFTSDAARVELAKRFGGERSWSASQLEDYANCPHQFFLKTVLRVRPLNEPELTTDFMGRGQMLHWLLAQAHRELNHCQGEPSTPCGDAFSLFAQAVERFAAKLRCQPAAGTLDAGMVEINVRQVLNWLDRYREHHAAYDALSSDWQAPLRPAHFEVTFGPQREEDGDEDLPDARDPLSSEEPFSLECAGEVVKFNGRIDRIDLGRYGNQSAFAVVDYKSGKPKGRTKLQSVWAGNSLQLPLYALAAERLLAQVDALPFRAAYWHMSGEGYQEHEAVKLRLTESGRLEISDEWAEMVETLKARIAALVCGVRRGEFPMYSTDEKCTGICDYAKVCRVNHARSREKSWQPPQEEQP
jgi:ATP-dependent helicase/DNAse subunit B